MLRKWSKNNKNDDAADRLDVCESSVPVTVTFQTVQRASDIAEVETIHIMERLVAVQRIEHRDLESVDANI